MFIKQVITDTYVHDGHLSYRVVGAASSPASIPGGGGLWICPRLPHCHHTHRIGPLEDTNIGRNLFEGVPTDLPK